MLHSRLLAVSSEGDSIARTSRTAGVKLLSFETRAGRALFANPRGALGGSCGQVRHCPGQKHEIMRHVEAR